MKEKWCMHLMEWIKLGSKVAEGGEEKFIQRILLMLQKSIKER